MSGLICAGNVYIARFVNGVAGGEHGPINCKKFAYSPGQAEVKERKSRQRDTYGQALSAVTLPGTPEISIEFDDADPEVLQYALMGTLTDVADNSGSIVGERVTAHLGLWSKLAKRGVSSVVIKALPGVAPVSPPTIVGTGTGTMSAVTCGDDALVGNYVVTLLATGSTAAFSVVAPDGSSLANGAVGSAYTSTHVNFTITAAGTMTIGDSFTIVTTGTTLALSDDYVLDATAGMIKAVTTGDINDGDDVQVNYSYGALTGSKIVAGTETEIRAQIRLDGVNLDNQKKVDVVVWEAKLTTNGEIDPMSEDFVTTGLKGILVTPSGKSGPLEYRELD